MLMIQAIAFDFDGVIVDSNRLKYDAWFHLFSDHTEVSEALVRDVLSRISQTRYDILREIFIQIGKEQSDVEKLVLDYGARYNTLVQDAIAAGGVIGGVRETLEALAPRYALYINSATPHEALQEAVARAGFHSLIKAAYGTPATKEENLRAIMHAEGIGSNEILMVGDGEGDLSAARKVGCPFIGVANEWNKWHDKDFPLVSDLRPLPHMIPGLTR